jgi:hypothetical protein
MMSKRLPKLHTYKSSRKELIGEINVKPLERPQLSLGNYTADKPPKGFLIEINPNPSPLDAVIAQVLSFGSEWKYELRLQVANNGEEEVGVQVWGL